MAENSSALQQELVNAENNLKMYQDPNAGINIRNQVNQQWTPVLQNAVQDTSNQMKDYLSSYLGNVYDFGTSEADLSPQQKMQYLGNQLGGMTGRLSYSSNLSSYLGGKMNEMAQNALNAWQLGNQAAASTYDRLFQRYQLALQMEEAERARRAQAALASQMYGQGSEQQVVDGTGDAIEVPDETISSTGNTVSDILKGIAVRTPIGAIGTVVGGLIGGGPQGALDAIKGAYAPEYDIYNKVTSGLNTWSNVGNALQNFKLPKITIPINR
jgi:hypothetical protein